MKIDLKCDEFNAHSVLTNILTLCSAKQKYFSSPHQINHPEMTSFITITYCILDIDPEFCISSIPWLNPQS